VSSFLEAIQIVLQHEGGYIEHPDDPAGATNWGISLRFAQSMNPLFEKKDIKQMSRQDAINIYYDGFWEPNRYEEIKCDIIATKVFDACVNMGAYEANKIIQKSCNRIGSNLKIDGICGTNTITVVNDLNCVALLINIRIMMKEFYQELAKNKGQQVFIGGWLKRADW